MKDVQCIHCLNSILHGAKICTHCGQWQQKTRSNLELFSKLSSIAAFITVMAGALLYICFDILGFGKVTILSAKIYEANVKHSEKLISQKGTQLVNPSLSYPLDIVVGSSYRKSASTIENCSVVGLKPNVDIGSKNLSFRFGEDTQAQISPGEVRSISIKSTEVKITEDIYLEGEKVCTMGQNVKLSCRVYSAGSAKSSQIEIPVEISTSSLCPSQP